MTRYTVVWVESAQDELAALWTDAADRDAVTAATHTIDTELSVNAHDKGVEVRGIASVLCCAAKGSFLSERRGPACRSRSRQAQLIGPLALDPERDQ